MHLRYSHIIVLIAAQLLSVSTALHAQWIETAIALPKPASARDLIYNPVNNKIYTANTNDQGMPDEHSATIIDGATNTIIKTIPMAKGSREVEVNTVSNKVYIANYFADSVTVIDGATDNVIAVMAAGDGPRAFAFSTKQNKMYCANEISGTVTVIDGVTNKVVATIKVGSTPRVLCYNPKDDKIYCPNAGSKNLSVIDCATDIVVETVATGNTPRGVDYNEASNTVYCSNYSSDNITVIDGITNKVVTTITVGDGPTAMFYCPEGSKMYCTNVGAPGPNTPKDCSVSVIDAITHKVLKTITAGDEPTAFCYSPRNKKLYWVDEWSHRVSVVDVFKDEVIKTISLGTGTVQPVDMCYNPVNERMYTANRLTYNLTVITDSLNTTTNPIILITSTAIVKGKVGTPYSYPVKAQSNVSDPIRYALVTAPTGMRIDSVSGLITWAAPIEGAYPVSLRAWMVSGGKPYSATQNFTLVIESASAVSVTFTSNPLVTGTEDKEYTYLARAVSSDTTRPVRYALTTAPSGMSIDSLTGRVSWPKPALGSHSVVIRASVISAGTTYSATQTFTLVIEKPRPPLSITFTSNPPLTGVEGKPYSYRVRAVASDTGKTVTFRLAMNAPEGMTLQMGTNTISWPSPVKGSYPITIIARVQGDSIIERQTYTLVISPDTTTSVSEDGRESLFRAYPNPASESMTLEFASPLTSEAVIEIIDARGLVVQRVAVPIGSIHHVISLSTLPAGIYHVRPNTRGDDRIVPLIIQR
jgi:YVTN family beta-propeller protein